jgi:hypothetical protein
MLLLGAGEGWSRIDRPPFVDTGFVELKKGEGDGFGLSEGEASFESPLAILSKIDLVAEVF